MFLNSPVSGFSDLNKRGLGVIVCEKSVFLLLGRVDESVVFQSHFTGESLTIVGRGAVGVDQVIS